MQGFPYSNEPEISMRVELWVGVTPSGWMQMMPRGNESPARCDETKGRGLGVYQAQWNSNSTELLSLTFMGILYSYYSVILSAIFSIILAVL